MTLARLIDMLIRLQAEHGDKQVSIMQETTLPAHLPVQGEKQVESLVRDIAASSDRVIIIGKELD